MVKGDSQRWLTPSPLFPLKFQLEILKFRFSLHMVSKMIDPPHKKISIGNFKV